MARRDWSGIAVVVGAAVLLVAVFSFLALAIPLASRSPEGPQLAFMPVTFQFPNTTFDGHEIWYNFTVTSHEDNLTWDQVQIQIEPGPLTKAPTNWSLEVRNSTLGTIAVYVPDAGNWTSTGSAPVSAGETIVLETDSSLVFGGLTALYPSQSTGSWSVEIPPD